MKVAVIGANGYVRGRLVPELLAADHDVRCLARTPEHLDRIPRGVAGRAYWWALLPIHKIIWKRLARRLVALAERDELP